MPGVVDGGRELAPTGRPCFWRSAASQILALAGLWLWLCALQPIPNQGAHTRGDLFSAALVLRWEAILVDRILPRYTEEVGHCRACAFRNQCDSAGGKRRSKAEVALPLASEGVLRYLWESRYGAILIEVPAKMFS